MKSLRLIALGAALAVFAQTAAVGYASHYPRKARHMLAHRSVRAGSANQSRYYVPYVTDAAGRPVPIMQIPGSITVVPRQVIDDQQDITICGALRNISSVFCR
jgi:outer membrane receptor protein involved in Fe transport